MKGRRKKEEGRKWKVQRLFRVSNFDHWIWSALLGITHCRTFAGAGAPQEEDPLLFPPYPEIPPSYWEENRAWIVVAGVVVLVGLTVLVWLLTRKRPVKPVPPEVEARQTLHSLARLPEDDRVVSRVSQVVKRYFIAAFGLPAGELTTAEFRHSLEADVKIDPRMADEVGEFLHQCDQYKFAPASGKVPGAARRAMKFIDEVEAHRAREMQRSDAGPSQPVSKEA